MTRIAFAATALRRSAYRTLLAAIASSFCAPAYAAWQKEGATPGQLKKDQSQCEMRARSDADVNRINPGPPGTRAGATLRGANTMAQQTRYFELCMRERGYEWVDAKTPGKTPEAQLPQTEGEK